MDIVLLIIRLALAGVFGVAGIAKLFDPAGSEKAFTDFGLPVALAKAGKVLLPALELAIALSLLFVTSSWFAAIGAAALLGAFTIGMLAQMAKGNAPDCHCFGQLHSEPVGASSIVRNVVLLAAGAVLIYSGRSAQGTPLIASEQEVMPLVLGLAVLALLVSAVIYLKTISQQQLQIMRRIEMLELVSREGAVEREDAGHPHDGLPIGGIVPDFTGEDLRGEAVSLAELKADERQVLFVYVSPTCAPCKTLIPDLEAWLSEFDGKLELVLVSSGKAAENLEKFGETLAPCIVLQQKKEISDLLHARWTPSAVLMDASGRIASHIAAGDLAIKDLVENIRHGSHGPQVSFFTNSEDARVKIGEAVPEIKVSDIEGRELTAADFRGRSTLVTFWSTTCPHCTNMLPDLREWDTNRSPGDPELVVFSDGPLEELRTLGLRSPIILDEGHKTSTGFGMFGTPSAVLINEHGRFVSETAAGAENIWSLIGKRKNGKAN